jgi:hypothetical protein
MCLDLTVLIMETILKTFNENMNEDRRLSHKKTEFQKVRMRQEI